MSTLKVDTVSNNGSAVNVAENIKIGTGLLRRTWIDAAAEPTADLSEGDLWWNSGSSDLSIYLDSGSSEFVWYTIGHNLRSPYFGERALFIGGMTGSNSFRTTIDYMTVQTLGNAGAIGNLSIASSGKDASAGLLAGRYIVVGDALVTTGTQINQSKRMEYGSIGTGANAADFGNRTGHGGNPATASNGPRMIMMHGDTNSSPYGSSNIEYVEFATLGNSVAFGTADVTRGHATACASATGRAVIAGRATNSYYHPQIGYRDIAVLGNAGDFGNLYQSNLLYMGGTSNATRALFAGGSNYNTIQYIDMANLGNALDFGNMTASTYKGTCAAGDATRALIFGGHSASNSIINMYNYVSYGSPGNGVDFGDLTVARSSMGACSGNV